MPESDAILVIWIKLLTLSGKINSGGFIFLTENIPYTDEMLSTLLNRPINTVRLALQTFKRFGMIEYDEANFLHIINWDKHQNIDGLDKIREQNRLRQQKKRSEQKALPLSRDSNVTVTQSHATDIDIDIDIDKEKIIIITPEQVSLFEVLKTIPNYPFSEALDLEMFNRLSERYPTLDIIEAAKDWREYKSDHPLKAKDNPRSQFNTSCKKYNEWGKCQNVLSKQPNKQLLKKEQIVVGGKPYSKYAQFYD